MVRLREISFPIYNSPAPRGHLTERQINDFLKLFSIIEICIAFARDYKIIKKPNKRVDDIQTILKDMDLLRVALIFKKLYCDLFVRILKLKIIKKFSQTVC